MIAGEPIDPPEGAEVLRVGDVTLHHFSDGPRDVVVFERGGHTCVLAGEVIHGATIEELAAWRGRGSRHVLAGLSVSASTARCVGRAAS